jgi:hypothetical protein
MTTMRAPDFCKVCAFNLDPKDVQCGACGWKVSVEDMVPVVKQLACQKTHMCDRPAKTSIFIDGQRVNSCLQCYHEHRDAELKNFDPAKAAREREERKQQALARLEIGSR